MWSKIIKKYKTVAQPYLLVSIGASGAVILSFFFSKDFSIGIIVTMLGCFGVYILSEMVKRPGSDVAFASIALSVIALLIAGLALQASLGDSRILQEQLAELKKISDNIESKK